MEKINYYIEKYKIIMLILLGLLVLIFVVCYVFLNKNNSNDKNIELIEEKNETTDELQISNNTIKKLKVDIKGFVKSPGVYEVVDGDRVIDVINLAGGLSKDANTEYINLSKKVSDEMIIIIYSNSEVEKFKQTEKQIIYIQYECFCPDNENDACINTNDIVNTNGTNIENIDSIDEKISINTSTVDDLKKIDGIGDVKAKAIIEYRNTNGLFKSIDDIKNVPGIGESVYSKIKDYIKL